VSGNFRFVTNTEPFMAGPRRAGFRPTATYSGATGNDRFTPTPAVVLANVPFVVFIVVTKPDILFCAVRVMMSGTPFFALVNVVISETPLLP
jgi:hypothetical protein